MLNLIIYWMYSNYNPRIKSTLNQHNEIGGLKERENMHVDYREDKQIHLLCFLSFPWLWWKFINCIRKTFHPQEKEVMSMTTDQTPKHHVKKKKAIFTNSKANKLEKSWSSLVLYGGRRRAWWPAVKSRWGWSWLCRCIWVESKHRLLYKMTAILLENDIEEIYRWIQF
jgi:hypothetical protein